MPRSSGGIGLKMVEALVNLGLRVTLLVLGAKVMTPLDAEMIAVLHQELVSVKPLPPVAITND